jgi:hypothetical protein
MIALFQNRGYERVRQFTWILIFTIFTIFIGLRNEVGADWQSYKSYFDYINQNPPASGEMLSFVLNHDIGYVILSWLSADLGFG